MWLNPPHREAPARARVRTSAFSRFQRDLALPQERQRHSRRGSDYLGTLIRRRSEPAALLEFVTAGGRLIIGGVLAVALAVPASAGVEEGLAAYDRGEYAIAYSELRKVMSWFFWLVLR